MKFPWYRSGKSAERNRPNMQVGIKSSRSGAGRSRPLRLESLERRALLTGLPQGFYYVMTGITEGEPGAQIWIDFPDQVLEDNVPIEITYEVIGVGLDSVDSDDFDPAFDTITQIPSNGTSSLSFFIPTIDDGLLEPDEYFQVILGSSQVDLLAIPAPPSVLSDNDFIDALDDVYTILAEEESHLVITAESGVKSNDTVNVVIDQEPVAFEDEDVVLVSQPQYGTLDFHPDGSFEYLLNPNASGG